MVIYKLIFSIWQGGTPLKELRKHASDTVTRYRDNRKGNNRDLFKKIRDTKGTFQAKMGTKKERNDMDLTEAEDIKRWQEYTESHHFINRSGNSENSG